MTVEIDLWHLVCGEDTNQSSPRVVLINANGALREPLLNSFVPKLVQWSSPMVWPDSKAISKTMVISNHTTM